MRYPSVHVSALQSGTGARRGTETSAQCAHAYFPFLSAHTHAHAQKSRNKGMQGVTSGVMSSLQRTGGIGRVCLSDQLAHSFGLAHAQSSISEAHLPDLRMTGTTKDNSNLDIALRLQVSGLMV